MKITEIRLDDRGIDNTHYFQGAGVAFTDYTACFIGVGHTFAEAADDAIEQAFSVVDDNDGLARLIRAERIPLPMDDDETVADNYGPEYTVSFKAFSGKFDRLYCGDDLEEALAVYIDACQTAASRGLNVDADGFEYGDDDKPDLDRPALLVAHEMGLTNEDCTRIVNDDPYGEGDMAVAEFTDPDDAAMSDFEWAGNLSIQCRGINPDLYWHAVLYIREEEEDEYTCPTDSQPYLDPKLDASRPEGLSGCGSTFTATLDDEGYVDCPNCGLFFQPDTNTTD